MSGSRFEGAAEVPYRRRRTGRVRGRARGRVTGSGTHTTPPNHLQARIRKTSARSTGVKSALKSSRKSLSNSRIKARMPSSSQKKYAMGLLRAGATEYRSHCSTQGRTAGFHRVTCAVADVWWTSRGMFEKASCRWCVDMAALEARRAASTMVCGSGWPSPIHSGGIYHAGQRCQQRRGQRVNAWRECRVNAPPPVPLKD